MPYDTGAIQLVHDNLPDRITKELCLKDTCSGSHKWKCFFQDQKAKENFLNGIKRLDVQVRQKGKRSVTINYSPNELSVILECSDVTIEEFVKATGLNLEKPRISESDQRKIALYWAIFNENPVTVRQALSALNLDELLETLGANVTGSGVYRLIEEGAQRLSPIEFAFEMIKKYDFTNFLAPFSREIFSRYTYREVMISLVKAKKTLPASHFLTVKARIDKVDKKMINQPINQLMELAIKSEDASAVDTLLNAQESDPSPLTKIKTIAFAIQHKHWDTAKKLLAELQASNFVLQANSEESTLLSEVLVSVLNKNPVDIELVKIAAWLLKMGARVSKDVYYTALPTLLHIECDGDKNAEEIVQHFLNHSDFLRQFPGLPQVDQLKLIVAAAKRKDQNLLKTFLEMLPQANCANEEAKSVLGSVLKDAMTNKRMEIVDCVLQKNTQLADIALQEAVRTEKPGIFILKLLSLGASTTDSFNAKLTDQIVLQHKVVVRPQSGSRSQFFFAKPTKIQEAGKAAREEEQVKNVVMTDKFFDFVHIIINTPADKTFPQSQQAFKALQTKVLEMMMQYFVLLNSGENNEVKKSCSLLWKEIVEALQTQRVDQLLQEFLQKQLAMLSNITSQKNAAAADLKQDPFNPGSDFYDNSL